MSARGYFLNQWSFTYLETYIEKPLLDFLLSSKIVLRLYLDEPGELVKSLVKSDFLPYPTLVPLFRMAEGIL